ncbi:prolyl aminopeptidase [Haloechinothrix sp. LS1_15]|uniref:prolyl aminopeptidase n=1 Tax=Haloechinothrix sp. LS1_15 TaxID=2652248 RepID=UPI002946A433|nr:prolyl aminopeptidase [Haloechinothrix sp. LS1_15]MDV6014078.1 prolyl aminopeptidase [Haloechinothrix sp. LS1_15]
MAALYQEIEPYAYGMLDVGDGNRVYWEACGNPDGKPAVVLHGGPGSGCTADLRRYFDPRAYRIVLFDQRGCGRSVPYAGDAGTDLSVNTTDHLLADMELLREHLGIERWLLFGGSWGTTLALVYGQRHPERVSEIVLMAVTSTRRCEIDWLYHGLGRFLPEAWARFREGVPAGWRDGDLVEAYHRLLADADPAVRERAAREWCAWELAVAYADVGGPGDAGGAQRFDPRFEMAFARIVTHYFRHGAWLTESEVLRNASKLAGTPGTMVHGTLDLGAPLVTAWELARAWPESDLVVVPGAGHDSKHGGMIEHLVAATDRYAGRDR